MRTDLIRRSTASTVVALLLSLNVYADVQWHGAAPTRPTVAPVGGEPLSPPHRCLMIPIDDPTRPDCWLPTPQPIPTCAVGPVLAILGNFYCLPVR